MIGNGSAAGIVGAVTRASSSGTITSKVYIVNSAYTGKIEYSGGYVSGISNNQGGTLEIVNCYNAGKITGKYANIYGISSGANLVQNCVNYSDMTEVNYGSIYPITSSSVINSYYLDYEDYFSSAKDKYVTYYSTNGKKTYEELHSLDMVKILNEFEKNANASVFLKKWIIDDDSKTYLKLNPNEYVTIYNKSKHKLEIDKIDEQTQAKLTGAEFKIEKEELVGEYSTVPEVKALDVKAMDSYSDYDFDKLENNYISNNKGVANSEARGIFEIDLTNYIGTYELSYNALVSCSSYDYGYTVVSTNNYLSASFGSFTKDVNISGEKSGSYSKILSGGQKYYFMIGYRKSNQPSQGADNFIVGNIKLRNKENNKYYSLENIAYSSKLQAADTDKIAEIDLTSNPNEKYYLEVEANISSEENGDYGYVVVNNTQVGTPLQGEKEKGLIYISGEVTTKKAVKELQGGTTYYVHMGYNKNDSTDSGKDLFEVKSIKVKKYTDYDTITTNSNGKASVNVEPNTTLRVTEIKAPNGYKISNYTNTLNITADTTLTVTNKKDALYTITKMDEEKDENGNNIPLKNVKFALYELNSTRGVIGQAKYSNGNYVGTLENGIYVVTTDLNGQIKLNLPEGYYKAVEVQTAAGYILEEDEQSRTTYFYVIEDEAEPKFSGTEVIISTPADLQTVANNVNSGIDDYKGKTLKLANNIDMNEYTIVIGDGNYVFRGNFNGNNQTISNLNRYLFGTIDGSDIGNVKIAAPRLKYSGVNNINSYAGLIANAYNSNLYNIKVLDGTIGSGGPTSKYGGIVLNMEKCVMNNCSNTLGFNIGYGHKGAGLVYSAKDSKIINSSNNSTVSSMYGTIAGLVYEIDNTKIINCSNTFNGKYWGNSAGIVFEARNSSIIMKCSNSGEYTGGYGSYGGIVNSANNTIIENCYNNANIDTDVNFNSSGIADDAAHCLISDCYNMGNIRSSVNSAGIIRYLRSSKLYNCYNIGNITATNFDASGICYSVTTQDGRGNEVKNCYNSGNISAGNNGKSSAFYATINATTNLENCYCLEGTAQYLVAANSTSSDTQKYITQDYLTSQEFVQELNNNKKALEGATPQYIWKYNGDNETNKYPTLVPNSTITTSSAIITNRKTEQRFINITKIDEDTEEQLEGAKIKVERIDNNDEQETYSEIGTYISSKTEAIKVKVFKNQRYRITEIEAPEGYDLSETSEIVEPGEDEIEIVIKNKATPMEYNITTKVEIPEGRIDRGGTISGEDSSQYEIVKHKTNSTKDIVITPDEGYRVKEIRVVSTSTVGNKTEKTIYGENADSTSEIKALQRKDGSIILTKFIEVTENKEVIVVFEPNEGTVIVHHYIEDTTRKIHKDQIIKGIIGTVVETNPVENETYLLVQEPEDKNPEIKQETQERTYYYNIAYKITTDVIEHTEGTDDHKVKGGSISGEDEDAYELVAKGRNNAQEIVMKPNKGYEIVHIKIDGEEVDFESYKDDYGTVTLPQDYFQNVQKDIHVEVEYRKAARIIVKYLEEDTENVLYTTESGQDRIVILGHDGDEFTTEHKIIPGYIDSSLGITDTDKELINTHNGVEIVDNSAQGTMKEDELEIIYWYKKVESGVVVRHIEINEKGEVTELDNEIIDGTQSSEVLTERKEYVQYISVNGEPAPNENIIVVNADSNLQSVEPDTNVVKEVWYYYEKQYKVTTEVKSHIEKDENENEVQVDGGTISKEYKKDSQGEYILDSEGNKIEIPYENILNRADSSKEIRITPEDTYRVKSVTVNGETVNIEQFKVENSEEVILPEKYFEDVQENKHVVVEFEKIPATVIVKYIDVQTGEEVLEDKVINGGLKDDYNEARVDVEGYVPAEPEPDNSQGQMTEETITIIYYYDKEFKITTDVKEHEEPKDKNVIDLIIDMIDEKIEEAGGPESGSQGGEEHQTEKIMVKGGSITGELTDENTEPIEKVLRGKDSTKEIEMNPDETYRIKSVTIYEGEKDENGNYSGDIYEIDTQEISVENGKVIIPKQYFTNVQSDKHIVVEYEKIPSRVIVNYKEKSTEEDVAKQLIGQGHVGDEYITHEQEIPYYELLKDELPENAEGVLVEEDTVVNYWYRKFLFNMKIKKEFTSIEVNGKETLGDDKSFAKVDIKDTDLSKTNITVKYKVTIINTEEIAGTTVIAEQIPVGFKFKNAETDGWTLTDGKYLKTTKVLEPKESVEYEVILEWDRSKKLIGNLENIARIVDTENEPKFEETTLEDNQDSCMLIISIRTGEDRTVRKNISIVCFVLAGILTIYYIASEIYFRRKEK